MRNIKDYISFINELYSALPKVGDEDLNSKFQNDYEKVKNVINSCVQPQQLDYAEKYFRNFNMKYQKIIDGLRDNKDKEDFYYSIKELEDLLRKKRKEIEF